MRKQDIKEICQELKNIAFGASELKQELESLRKENERLKYQLKLREAQAYIQGILLDGFKEKI